MLPSAFPLPVSLNIRLQFEGCNFSAFSFVVALHLFTVVVRSGLKMFDHAHIWSDQ